LHDAGVSANDKDHLSNGLQYSMNVADYPANARDYSSAY
jgi:hypothetical protein